MAPGARQWRRFAAAAAALVLPLLASCSGSGASTGSTAPAATTPGPSSRADPAAAAALAQAVRVTAGVRSYAFRASQQLTGGSHPQGTLLTGRAVRPAAIRYSLLIGGRSQDVITVGGRTYVRVPPAGWKVLAKAGATTDPLTSLLALLHALTSPTLTGHSLRGLVPAAVLTQAGLAPAGAAADAFSPVTMTLDDASRVTELSLRLSIGAGGHQLRLTESTSFADFNAVSAIRPPGAVAGK